MKFLIVSLLLVGLTFAFRTQSTGVKGKLMCGSKPAVGVHLKLFDEDNGMLVRDLLECSKWEFVTGPDPDDILDQKTTDEEGNFELSGSSMELTPIDPEIRIFHDCNDHGSVSKNRNHWSELLASAVSTWMGHQDTSEIHHQRPRSQRAYGLGSYESGGK